MPVSTNPRDLYYRGAQRRRRRKRPLHVRRFRSSRLYHAMQVRARDSETGTMERGLGSLSLHLIIRRIHSTYPSSWPKMRAGRYRRLCTIRRGCRPCTPRHLQRCRCYRRCCRSRSGPQTIHATFAPSVQNLCLLTWFGVLRRYGNVDENTLERYACSACCWHRLPSRAVGVDGKEKQRAAVHLRKRARLVLDSCLK